MSSGTIYEGYLARIDFNYIDDEIENCKNELQCIREKILMYIAYTPQQTTIDKEIINPVESIYYDVKELLDEFEEESGRLHAMYQIKNSEMVHYSK